MRTPKCWTRCTIVVVSSIYRGYDGNRKRGYVKAGVNKFCFDDLFARFDADTSISEESKEIIASRVINHRAFSREWDVHFGNGPDPTLIQTENN